jgi:hypothetical protein
MEFFLSAMHMVSGYTQQNQNKAMENTWKEEHFHKLLQYKRVFTNIAF